MIRDRIAGVVGNLLEHYDSALFGLLAPFIAPLFFEPCDPITGLILTYGMMPLGILTKPLGSLCFGWIGDHFGRKQALCLSLLGMAIMTMGIGCLPVYREIGIWAPILLATGRMLQSFCAAGEVTGGAIFVLEHTPHRLRSLFSSLYDVSTVAGIMIASGCVAALSYSIEDRWRYLFWAGGVTAVIGLFLRLVSKEAAEFKRDRKGHLFQILNQYWRPLLSILIASGFGYTTYSLAFTLMNGFVPLLTSLTKVEIIQVNTPLLLVDMTLLPLFGYLAIRFGKEKVMLGGAILASVCAIPLFSLLGGASLSGVIAIRFAIITCGVAFSAPYYAWAIEQVPPEHRYLILSFGGSLGTQIIGVPSAMIGLWLYKTTGWAGSPGIYLMAVALGAVMVVRPRTS
jgi:MHS family proline/betaine transporter-like MFS transporter